VQVALGGVGHLAPEAVEEPTPPPVTDAVTAAEEGHEDGTDEGMARRFVRLYRDQVRYVAGWEKWLVWDGRRWKLDDEKRVRDLARRSALALLEEAAKAPTDQERDQLTKQARKVRDSVRIRAALWLACSDPEIVISHESLDAHPWLLNAENGTIDLRKGQLREHRREDLLTKMVPVAYDPQAEAPRFRGFLDRVQPDPEVRDYLQTGLGYSLTASTDEECVFVSHGGGANGKTTLVEVVRAALGDYSIALPQDSILQTRGSAIPNDLAKLPGRRFATVVETPENRRLDEERLKALASGDQIAARFMRQEWFEFRPRAKYWIATNHRPSVHGDDDGVWRRIRLIPWTVQIPDQDQDKRLREKLLGELPGILAWLVEGCLRWQREGLRTPDSIREATHEYRTDEDVLGAFIAERCDTGDGLQTTNARLRKSLDAWCKNQGHGQVPTPKAVAMRLVGKGFAKCRIGTDRGWRGISPLDEYSDYPS